MRHRVSGRQLSRNTSHRKAMRRNMAVSLFQYGAIRTTEAKAKELRRFAEKLITIAKKGTLHARRQIITKLGDRNMADEDGNLLDQTVVQKLFGEIASKYADRPGGYTRIIRLAEYRIGDAGREVLLQLVEQAGAESSKEAAGSSRRKRRAAKRHAAADAQQQPPQDQADQATSDETTEQAPQTETEDAGRQEEQEKQQQ